MNSTTLVAENPFLSCQNKIIKSTNLWINKKKILVMLRHRVKRKRHLVQ
jgi:hypothetical protein